MQLDRTRIVIRQRSWFDLLDLSLRVGRNYAGPLLAALIVGIVPAMLLNAWILGGLLEPRFDGENAVFQYVYWMLLLVVWEMPLATSVATLYLGEAVFQERPRPGGIAGDFLRALPQLVFFQVFLRGLFIPLVFTLFIPFSLHPYLNEVILLERNPWTSHSGQMTTFRRSRALHRDGSGDFFARWIASLAFGALLVVALGMTMQTLAVSLLNEEWWCHWVLTFFYPLALWAVIGYFTVARFLGYLDLRIRREGWDLELMTRAEGIRLSKPS